MARTLAVDAPESALRSHPRDRSGTSRIEPERIILDPFRAFVFPNRIREQRRKLGFQKLMPLSNALPEIPYIRLSKIERGEVVARTDELVRIGAALDLDPAELLIDIDEPGFDIALWAAPFRDPSAWSEADDRVAVMLGAAMRVLRNQDRRLTISVLESEYGLPAVILSRIENAHKPLDRWNDATIASLCRLFEVADSGALVAKITKSYENGHLDGYVSTITNPDARQARTRERIAALAADLAPPGPGAKKRITAFLSRVRPTSIDDEQHPPLLPPPAPAQVDAPGVRQVAVFGSAEPGGLIAATSTDIVVEAPRTAGPRAFGLRVCRATLGVGLPATAIVVVDPDARPSAGGLAAIRSGDGYRLVSVTFDRAGVQMGYSVQPDIAINLDELEPADIAAVVSAIYPA